MSVYLYLMINVGIGVLAGLIFLIIKIATMPKMCDSCKKLIRKGGKGARRYECSYNHPEEWGLTMRFDRCPKYCKYYDPMEVNGKEFCSRGERSENIGD